MMKKISIEMIAKTAMIAGLYAVMTWLLAPISYGPIQFRFSEILILLVVLNPKYSYALVIGCFVANTTSSLGWYDMVFGTLATILAILPMIKIKRIELAAIFPVITNAFIVALELYLCFKESGVFWLNVGTIALGEAVVLYLVGIPVMIYISNHSRMNELLEIEPISSLKSKSWSANCLLELIVLVIGMILYFAYPLAYRDELYLSMFTLTKEALWLMILPILLALGFLFYWIPFNIGSMILKILCWIGIVGIYVSLGVMDASCCQNAYYYGFIVYLLLGIGEMTYVYIKRKKGIANGAC